MKLISLSDTRRVAAAKSLANEFVSNFVIPNDTLQPARVLTVIDYIKLNDNEDDNEERDGDSNQEKLLFPSERPRRRKRYQNFTFTCVHWIS